MLWERRHQTMQITTWTLLLILHTPVMSHMIGQVSVQFSLAVVIATVVVIPTFHSFLAKKNCDFLSVSVVIIF